MKRDQTASGMDLLVRPARAEASLWRRLRFDDEISCRRDLFDRYAELARSIAARHFHRRAWVGIDRNDFDQFAYEGLLESIDRFDPLNGTPFGAYASRRIAGSISDGIAKMSEIGTQLRHRHRLEQERLRSLTSASQLDGTTDAVSVLSELAVGLALGMMLEGALIKHPDAADLAPNAYESLEWREMQARLKHEVAELPEREAAIVRQHYDMGLSFVQIAELMGVSQGRISQLHRSALVRLRKRIGSLV